MPASDLVRMRHILDAARQALTFVQGWSRSDLDADHMLSLALVRLLEIISEVKTVTLRDLRYRFLEVEARRQRSEEVEIRQRPARPVFFAGAAGCGQVYSNWLR